MLESTSAFVLHTTNYSESSVIAKMLTRDWGVKSFVVKGVRGGKSRNKQNLLQPMSYLDMSVYLNEKAEIQFAKELKPAVQWNTIPYSCEKNAIVFFMNELLYKTIREEEPNPALFDFVVETLSSLDDEGCAVSDFPIRFMVKSTRQFGIEPLDNFSVNRPFFNMQNGCFESTASRSDAFPETLLDKGTSLMLHKYLNMRNPYKESLHTPYRERNLLFSAMLDYFRIHFTNLSDFKSHVILHEILK